MHTDLKESLRWLHGNGSAVQQYMDFLSAVFKCQLVYTFKKRTDNMQVVLLFIMCHF